MFDEKQNQKDICRALAWQHGDKDAAEALLQQYQPLIRSIRQNFCRDLSYEDHEELTLEDQAEGTSLDDYGEAKATLEDVARLARLTEKQKPVFFLWMQGLTPMEIFTRTGDSLPSITRKKQRIQRQLSKYAKEIRGLVAGD